jgi:hypothetical protein
MKDPIAEEISIKEFYKRTNDLKNCDDMASCKVGLNEYGDWRRRLFDKRYVVGF